MGSVRFTCHCGEFSFLDSTDNRSYVGHLIPDQDLDRFWDVIDEAIERPAASDKGRADACMAARRYRMRSVWQCPRCGALYVEGPDGEPQRFVPESDAVSRTLLLPSRLKNP